MPGCGGRRSAARTLSLSLSPVIVGSALAWCQGAAIAWAPLLAAALCALLIQAGTNLFNDAYDAERGNDGLIASDRCVSLRPGWRPPRR